MNRKDLCGLVQGKNESIRHLDIEFTFAVKFEHSVARTPLVRMKAMKRTQHPTKPKVPSTIKHGQGDNALYFNNYEITRSPIKNNENKFSKADQKK